MQDHMENLYQEFFIRHDRAEKKKNENDLIFIQLPSATSFLSTDKCPLGRGCLKSHI